MFYVNVYLASNIDRECEVTHPETLHMFDDFEAKVIQVIHSVDDSWHPNVNI